MSIVAPTGPWRGPPKGRTRPGHPGYADLGQEGPAQAPMPRSVARILCARKPRSLDPAIMSLRGTEATYHRHNSMIAGDRADRADSADSAGREGQMVTGGRFQPGGSERGT